MMEYDFLCILPINILNEKIYVFLWFWFQSLAVLSILNMVYRVLVILMPSLRQLLLRRRVRNDYTSRSCNKLHVSGADLFLLSTLGENLNPVVFSETFNDIQNGMVKLNEPSALLSIRGNRDGMTLRIHVCGKVKATLRGYIGLK